jgi:hypothetical protein
MRAATGLTPPASARTGSARPALTCTRAGPTQSLPFKPRGLQISPHLHRDRTPRRMPLVAAGSASDGRALHEDADGAARSVSAGIPSPRMPRLAPGLGCSPLMPRSESSLGSPRPALHQERACPRPQLPCDWAPLPHLHLDTARSRPRSHQHCNSKATGLGAPRPTFVLRHGSPLEHVTWAHPSHIFSGTESARPSHVCTGTGRAPAHGRMLSCADRTADG